MKLDQIAYYAHNEEQVEQIKKQFGLLGSSWIEDTATGIIKLDGKGNPFKSVGHLRFNYALGIELEILTYLEGPHWHQDKSEFLNQIPFISHIGFHMEGSPEDFIPPEGFKLAQVMDTTEHTNEYIVEKGRKYHYEIYKPDYESFLIRPEMPDQKYIWRVENGK